MWEFTTLQLAGSLVHGLLNGFYFASYLFLVGIGLSFTFRVVSFVNFSHTVFMVLSMFLTVSAIEFLNDYVSGLLLGLLGVLVIGPILTTIIGIIGEKVIFERIYSNLDLQYQLLSTFAILIISLDLIRLIWGVQPARLSGQANPFSLLGQVNVIGQSYSLYNVIVILIGGGIGILTYLAITRSKFGKIAQAVAENEEMSRVLGINASRVQFGVQIYGIAMVALAGSLMVATIAVTPNIALVWLILGFVVIIIGGVGGFRGALVGAIIVGMTRGFGDVFTSRLSFALPFLIMAIVLALKPSGLITARGIK